MRTNSIEPDTSLGLHTGHFEHEPADTDAIDHGFRNFADEDDGDVLDRCPSRDIKLKNLDTGEVINGTCKTFACPYCGMGCFWRRARAIEASKPTHSIGLSFPMGSFRFLADAMTGLSRRLRRIGHKELRWLWVTEDDPNGRGRHVHAVAHGADDLDDWTLQKAATSNGARPRVFVEAIDGPRHLTSLSSYLFKCALTPRTVKTPAKLREHLDRNGGKPEHHSRGFFRDRDGNPVTIKTMTIPKENSGRWVVIASN